MLHIRNVLWLEAAAKRKLQNTYDLDVTLWKLGPKIISKHSQALTLWQSHPFETESGVFAPFRGVIGANGDQSFQLQSAVPDDQGPLQRHKGMEK